MAEKDLNEKVLEDYNDVFADIYNTLVFRNGYIQEASLSLLSLGIENQYDEDAAMPARIMGYDYGTYRGMEK